MADTTIAPGAHPFVPIEYLNVPCAGTPSDPMPLGGGARRPCIAEAREPLPGAVREAIAPLWRGSEDFASNGYGTLRLEGVAPVPGEPGIVVVTPDPVRPGTIVLDPSPVTPPAVVSLPAAGALLMVTLLLVAAAFRRRG